MAHLLDTMAYAGETPWHGLGATLDRGASIDSWIRMSGLTWNAELQEIALAASGTIIDGRKAVVRSDNGEVFGLVSDRYKPVQPRAVLEFFRDLAGSHSMEIETAGSLKGGAVVWALATNDAKITVKGSDVVKPYLLLSTSYDASQASRGCFTTVRVVCNNTLRMSYSADAEGVVNVRHTSKFDEKEVKARLGIFSDQAETFADMANLLAETRVTGSQVKALLHELFGATNDAGELTTYSRNVMDKAASCILTSPGSNLDSARGTAWGVLNGITNYVDFHARAHNGDNRLDSAWFGRGDALKGDALNFLAGLNTRTRELIAA